MYSWGKDWKYLQKLNFITCALPITAGNKTQRRSSNTSSREWRDCMLERREINQRQSMESRSVHMHLATQNHLASWIEQLSLRCNALSFTITVYRWDQDGAGHISHLLPTNNTLRQKSQWHFRLSPGGGVCGALPHHRSMQNNAGSLDRQDDRQRCKASPHTWLLLDPPTVPQAGSHATPAARAGAPPQRSPPHRDRRKHLYTIHVCKYCDCV